MSVGAGDGDALSTRLSRSGRCSRCCSIESLRAGPTGEMGVLSTGGCSANSATSSVSISGSRAAMAVLLDGAVVDGLLEFGCCLVCSVRGCGDVVV